MKKNCTKVSSYILLFENVSCLKHQPVTQFLRDQFLNDLVVACTFFALL